MAWLGLDAPNIAQGWGGPPQLHAPDISGLVHSILQNRLAQQEFQQKTIADAIKQGQDERSRQAFLQAAQNAGVLPQGDYSGMDTKSAAALAQLIQAQTPDTAADALKKAQAAYYLGQGRQPRGGINQEREARIRANEQFKQQQAQAKILGTQAEDIASQQEDYGLKPDVGPATHGYVMRDGKLDYARTPEEQASPTLVGPGDAISDPNAPTFTPDVYNQRQTQSELRQKILAQKAGVEKQMLTPAAASTGGGSATTGIDALRSQAQAAIAQGAPEDAVKQRFRETTGQEL